MWWIWRTNLGVVCELLGDVNKNLWAYGFVIGDYFIGVAKQEERE